MDLGPGQREGAPLRVLLYGIVLFVLGFVPVIGQTVIPVLGFCVSGYFLTQEYRRRPAAAQGGAARPAGVDAPRRLLVLGFGVPLVLAFLVPLVAVFLMPGAVAGATLLARDLTAPPADDEDAAPSPYTLNKG